MTPTTEAEAPPLGVADHDGLTDAEGPIPAFGPVSLEPDGRIAMSVAEWDARAVAACRALAAIAERPDTDPPGIDLEIMRGMNESKPDRPPFPELL